MRNKITLTIFSFLILLLFIANNVLALPPPSTASFELEFSKLNLPEGEWNMYIIPIAAFRNPSEEKIFESYNFLKEDYISTKNECGTEDYDIWIRRSPPQKEIDKIKEHHPIVVIDERRVANYKFFIDEEYKDKYGKCSPHGGFNNFYYDMGLTSNILGQNTVKECNIKDDMCTILFHTFNEDDDSELIGNYFIVLEKINSTEDVYFSDLININWEAESDVIWDSGENYSLKITNLEQLGFNNLNISFTGSKPGEIPPVKFPYISFTGSKPGEIPPVKFPYVTYWIIGLAIVIISLVLFFSLKKKK
jgi:hypothetical protein